MEIILLRHGQTPGNLTHQYIGRTDEPLSEEGSKALIPYHNPSCRYVITSGMRRTNQTANLIFPGLPQTLNDDLQEMDFGVFERRTADEMVNDADYRSWVDGLCRGQIPNGEKLEGFSKRCCDAFLREVQQAEFHHEKQIAFVVHGGTIRAILHCFINPDGDFFDFNPKNGCGYLLNLETDNHDDLTFSLVREISCIKE